MALIEPISEKAFKQLAKRLLRVLKEQNPTAPEPPTLAFAQETLCHIAGLGSYHAVQQRWQSSSPSSIAVPCCQPGSQGPEVLETKEFIEQSLSILLGEAPCRSQFGLKKMSMLGKPCLVCIGFPRKQIPRFRLKTSKSVTFA
jgi:hypothetical protein